MSNKIRIDVTNVHRDEINELLESIHGFKLGCFKREKKDHHRLLTMYDVPIDRIDKGIDLCKYLEDNCWLWEYIEEYNRKRSIKRIYSLFDVDELCYGTEQLEQQIVSMLEANEPDMKFEVHVNYNEENNCSDIAVVSEIIGKENTKLTQMYSFELNEGVSE
jgi:hypothetical protein